MKAIGLAVLSLMVLLPIPSIGADAPNGSAPATTADAPGLTTARQLSIAELREQLPLALEVVHIYSGQIDRAATRYNEAVRAVDIADIAYKRAYQQVRHPVYAMSDIPDKSRDIANARAALAAIHSSALYATQLSRSLRAQPIYNLIYQDYQVASCCVDLASITRSLGAEWATLGGVRIDPNLRYVAKRGSGFFVDSLRSEPGVDETTLSDVRVTVAEGARLKPQAVAYIKGLSDSLDKHVVRLKRLADQWNELLATSERYTAAGMWMTEFAVKNPAVYRVANQAAFAKIRDEAGSAIGSVSIGVSVKPQMFQYLVQGLVAAGVRVPQYVQECPNPSAGMAELQKNLDDSKVEDAAALQVIVEANHYPLLSAEAGLNLSRLPPEPHRDFPKVPDLPK